MQPQEQHEPVSCLIAKDDRDFEIAMQNAFLSKQCIVAKEPYITTITSCFYLCHSPRNIKDIAEKVAHPDSTILKSLIDEVFGGQLRFYPKPHQGVFFNCQIFIMLEYDTTTNKTRKVSIKCFTNGTLHITGARVMHRAYEIAQMFCMLLELVEGGNGMDNTYTIKGHNVQLINVHVNLLQPHDKSHQSINLCRVYDILQNRTLHHTTYNNDRHSGVIVKFLTNNMIYVTILIFDSGNILLCGIKSISDFREAFHFLVEFIEQYIQEIYIDTASILHSKGKTKQQKGNQHFDYGKYIILK
jgi:TATA-box binding protein (TBP) (component of TFIID and TFIIIB)